jgi:hypothetical protein
VIAIQASVGVVMVIGGAMESGSGVVVAAAEVVDAAVS